VGFSGFWWYQVGVGFAQTTNDEDNRDKTPIQWGDLGLIG